MSQEMSYKFDVVMYALICVRDAAIGWKCDNENKTDLVNALRLYMNTQELQRCYALKDTLREAIDRLQEVVDLLKRVGKEPV